MASSRGNRERSSGDGGSPSPGERGFERATPRQTLRQAVVITLVVAIWSALLVVYLSLIPTSQQQAVAPNTATEDPVSPETSQPAATSTPLPSGTPLPPAETAAATATQPPTSEVEPAQPPPSPTSTAAASSGASGLSFAADVLPLLQTRCERCHGGRRTEAGFSTLTHADLMAGSYGVPVVIPGSAQDSRVVKVIISGDMPRRAPPMPEDEIEVISAWINEGALDN